MMPVSDSAWGELQDRVNAIEAGQRMIASGHVQLVEQMAEITVSQRRADIHRKEQTQRLDEIAVTLLNQDQQIKENKDNLQAIRDDLAGNTKTTKEILEATRDLRDVVITAKTGGRLAKWAAPTLVAAGVSIGILKGWALSSWEWLTK